MAKESHDTKSKQGDSSAFRKFERLAKKIVRVQKSQVRDDGKRRPT